VKIKINMLGSFVISSGNKRVVENVKRSSKLWKLLQYLVTHRNKSVSQEELIEKFCEDEILYNPGGALRTLIYRARLELIKSGIPYADDLILSKDRGYAWNNGIPCEVDAEEFEELCKKAALDIDEDERLKILLEATELYKGDFLPNSAGDMWVMPLQRWYRSLFINCAYKALGILVKYGRNIEAEELCVKALNVDPLDEKIIDYHLRALLAQGKHAEALTEYEKTQDMFYDVMGVHFSDNLRALYSKIKRPLDDTESMPLEDVLDEWLKDVDFPGAYYCDLSVFKVLCQIESRSVPRSGRTAYIVRIDTKHVPGSKGGSIMKQLGMTIPGCLRKGDLFTRSSPSQYMIMLYSLTYEDCKMLVNRIMSRMDARHLPKIIGTTIKSVKPTL